MNNNMLHFWSFELFINKLANMPYSLYHIIIVTLILVGTICNYESEQPLPLFWILVFGFAFIIYIDIYSIKQAHIFCKEMVSVLYGDNTLYVARMELMKNMYANTNWLFVLSVPAFIVPEVVFIIKFPLGLPIKIFAYVALYFIISLCIIGYMQYVNLIKFSYKLKENVNQIEKYDKNRPHKTNWIMEISALTNKQSNLFFIVGASYIALLYIITFSGRYGVNIKERTSGILVVCLWMIILMAIVIMFPVLSFCSYWFVKSLIEGLVKKSIQECYVTRTIIDRERKKANRTILLQLNDIKILMLEKTPIYPRKPFVSYAVSYVIAFINLAAAIKTTISLMQYFI